MATITPITTTPSSSSNEPLKKNKKQCLGWIEWLRGWFHLFYEFLFQRIMASHLHNPMPLPPINDLTCIVTGSTSGIGLEIARQLAESGAHVVMAVRNTKRANELIQKWQTESAGLVDLLSLDSVAKFAEAWNARAAPLHVLINNAGIFSIGEPQKFSKDGYEEHMQVNHLAPALLSILLLPSLIRGSPSRIVNVNSIMHHVGFVDSEDMNVTSGKRKFSSMVGYSSSKLAQVMFSSVLFKRLPAEAGISVLCASPGIVQTNVIIPDFCYNVGSRSTLFAATDPQISEYCELLKSDEWPVCAYISHDCRPANPSEEAHNLQTSFEVWEKTLEMIGLPSDSVDRFLEGEEVKCRYGQEQQ
ncbi:hypothetical protein TSUD_296730 [Trifolium subterraneum]|uniref:Uncharacterized protein n=1 Tax=Trifolium subterraneum TaxID=3900 RepID=A0A2Z6NRJ5_TRISU|nr:hypothetical protein TSUD_296730 [Trifolium subterraneum]